MQQQCLLAWEEHQLTRKLLSDSNGIVNDIAEFVKKCEPCQKQNSRPNNLKNELHSIPVPSQVMA